MNNDQIVTVDYGIPVEVVAQRFPGNVDPFITSTNFSTGRSGIHQLVMCSFRFVSYLVFPVSRRAVFDHMGHNGLRPGELHELIEIGIQFPRHNQALVAFGSYSNDPRDPKIPYISSEGNLEVGSYYWEWNSPCWFLAFKCTP